MHRLAVTAVALRALCHRDQCTLLSCRARSCCTLADCAGRTGNAVGGYTNGWIFPDLCRHPRFFKCCTPICTKKIPKSGAGEDVAQHVGTVSRRYHFENQIQSNPIQSNILQSIPTYALSFCTRCAPKLHAGREALRGDVSPSAHANSCGHTIGFQCRSVWPV